MKRTLSFLAVTCAAVCIVVAGFVSHFYYSRYEDAETELLRRIDQFNARLGRLEEHKARELAPVQISGWISTTDRDRSTDSPIKYFPEGNSSGPFEAISVKGGPIIRPEIRIPAGSTNDLEFDLKIPDHFGKIVDAWFSHAGPFQDLTSFSQFRVNCPYGTNAIRLWVQLRPGASVQMQFEILVLVQR